MEPITIVRPASAPAYPVFCGGDAPAAVAALWEQRFSRAVIVGDSNTDPLFAPALEEALAAHQPLRLSFPAGEGAKTRATKERLEDAMLAARIDRSACLVAVGGGVALDVGGFVAATYMRGIAHINVATTLLAQVDAAVGGKTAVNTLHGKNLVGAFHQPCAVVLDTRALAQLPDLELRNGLAEVIKHAVLRDESLFGAIEAWAQANAVLRLPDPLIARSVVIKADVVAADDRESGMRFILNYGHTAAHAIEHASNHTVPHGHAVAMGMVVEAQLAAQQGDFPEADLTRLRALLEQLGLPTGPPVSFAAAEPFFARDKKTHAEQIRCAIPSQIGHIAPRDDSWLHTVTLDALKRAWQACSA